MDPQHKNPRITRPIHTNEHPTPPPRRLIMTRQQKIQGTPTPLYDPWLIYFSYLEITSIFLPWEYKRSVEDPKTHKSALRVRFFGKLRIRIVDQRSLRSWCIKRTDESTLCKDSSVPLMYHDPSDLGSKIRIRIFPKKPTIR